MSDMAKSTDKARTQTMSRAGMQQELQAVRHQLHGQRREKLQVDRHRLDVEEEILRLQERKEELEQMIHGQSDQAIANKALPRSQEVVTDPLAIEQRKLDIPPEYHTPPVTLSRMADAIGGEMTRHKLRMLVNRGMYRAIQLNRQNWIFDTSQFGEHIVEKLRTKEKKNGK